MTTAHERSERQHDVAGLRQEDDGRSVSVSFEGTELGRYVYRSEAPPFEAPKPYWHPLRTVSGAPMSVYRPWDHRWHKGISMTLSHVSGQNFWGGPTFAAEDGYRARGDVGRVDHESFEAVTGKSDSLRLRERLGWITSQGSRWFDEQRTQTVEVDGAAGTWSLTFETVLVSVAGHRLELGSPTTRGRPAAGYTGLFWRGPRAWTGAAVLGPGGEVGEAAMGTAGPWLALSSDHDERDGGATLLALAGSSSASVPLRWFVRSSQFACLAPSPAFDTEVVVEPGEELRLRHRMVLVDRRCGAEELTALAAEHAL